MCVTKIINIFSNSVISIFWSFFSISEIKFLFSLFPPPEINFWSSHSIIDFINGDVDYFSKKGISVIRTMNGLKRTCENYKDDFDDLKRYCSCINYK